MSTTLITAPIARARLRTLGPLEAALILGGWTCFGLFSFAQSFIYYSWTDTQPKSWFNLLAAALGSAWIWALLTPGALWVTNRLSFEPDRRTRSLLLHFAAGIVFVVVSTALERVVFRATSSMPLGPFVRGLFYRFDARFLAYVVIVTLYQASRYFRLSRDRELHAAELEAQLARAELHALKAQLQPHFLFNTLNSIAELVHDDPEGADRVIGRLGHLLRLSLEQSGHQIVPLRQELDFLRTYLDIEQTRFQNRLSVKLDAEFEALAAGVPTLLLQPLMENAIRHGVAPRPQGGHISLRARRQGDRLEITIWDDGPGFSEGALRRRGGVGVRNTRERLRQLYGPEHLVTFSNASQGGAVVRIEVPYTECTQASTPVHLRPVTMQAAAR